MVIETVRYLRVEMAVLFKIQIRNEGVPEIAIGLDELVSNHCFSAKVIGRLSKTWAWAVITTLRRPNNLSDSAFCPDPTHVLPQKACRNYQLTRTSFCSERSS
jgi:hypothetical protein